MKFEEWLATLDDDFHENLIECVARYVVECHRRQLVRNLMKDVTFATDKDAEEFRASLTEYIIGIEDVMKDDE